MTLCEPRWRLPVYPMSDELIDRLAQLEAALRDLIEHQIGLFGPGERGNAPGHLHVVPGTWDDDPFNGPLAGQPCAWCKRWAEISSLLV